MNVYVASSWRCDRQPGVVKQLRDAGHDVYDFRNPLPGNHGFHWSEIDADWKNWSGEQFSRALHHPIAESGFDLDFSAMCDADTFVLVMPCGRSAHLELGWACGQGKHTAVLLDERQEPELMLSLACIVTTRMQVILDYLEVCVYE
jgi:hypothetical protein